MICGTFGLVGQDRLAAITDRADLQALAVMLKWPERIVPRPCGQQP